MRSEVINVDNQTLKEIANRKSQKLIGGSNKL